MTVKDKAIAKLLEEMSKEHSSTEDVIHNYLCEQEDEKLFLGILKEDRTIKGSIEYCSGKAKKIAKSSRSIMIDNDTVYKWVREYFIKDKINQSNVKADVSVTDTKSKENKKDNNKDTENKNKEEIKTEIKKENKNKDIFRIKDQEFEQVRMF